MVYQNSVSEQPCSPQWDESTLGSASQRAMMEDLQCPACVINTVTSGTDNFGVREKCLSWQNSYPGLATTETRLDNGYICSADGSVGNAQFQNNSSGSVDYHSSSDTMPVCKHHSQPADQTCARIRRDSEESEESMDTNFSLASSPYASSLISAYTDTMYNGSSADNLIRESDEEQDADTKILNCGETCEASFETEREKLPVGLGESPKFDTPSVSITVVTSRSVAEPFSCHKEYVDLQYATNPPVVTENLINVEDESFLQTSQLSLTESCSAGIFPGGFLTRASTLPDLQAYHRYHGEYGVSWAYQDARIFLSENALTKSMCSLTSAESMNLKTKYDIDCESGQNLDIQPQRPQHGQMVDSEGKPIKVVPSSDHTVVMVLLSLCVGVLFIAMGAIRNIQSSLYPKDGMGVTSLALIFAGYTFGSLVSAPLMRHVQPRTCLIISILPNILYLLANLSHRFWLLAPVSFLQGISMAIIWSAVSTYMTYLAHGRANSKGETIRDVCSQFFNFFSLIYQGSVILGNLVTSVLLKLGNSLYSTGQILSSLSSINSTALSPTPSKSDSDTSLAKMFPSLNQSLPVRINRTLDHAGADHLSNVCGAGFHTSNHDVDAGSQWIHPDDGTIYMLHGTFIGCTLVALGIAVFGIEPLNMNLLTSSLKQHGRGAEKLCVAIGRNLRDMMHHCRDVKFVLLIPLLMYSVMQFGFVSAEFTAAFISCPVGIDQVGFSMVLFALGGFPTSFFCGILTKKCGRLPLITLASTINLIALIILAQWRPGAGDVYLIHTMMFCWGLSDGIWISQANGLISSLFKHHYEATYGGMRVAQGLGVTILLSFSSVLDMRSKVIVMMAACVLGLLGYLLMRLCLYCENRRLQLQQQRLYQFHGAPCREDV